MKKLWMLWLAYWLLLPLSAGAQEAIWTLVTEDGQPLTQICYEPETGDEYIAADNQHYAVLRVENDCAVVHSLGTVTLPDVSWLNADAALPVSALFQRRINLYCTHSDESYEPSDGLYSNPERGSIYQVAHALGESLLEDGVEAVVSNQLHHPHDAGAYRRSRQTAMELLRENTPDAILDIHRDGIPDPVSYETTIGGQPCSKIRLLVGRGNQNMAVNKDFALTIKAVADSVYPGLIKDIYMGKGAFNQDLYPQSLLLECGTYTLAKERVLTSMPMVADVLQRVLYGGVTGSAGMSDFVRSGSAQENAPQEAPAPGADETAPDPADRSGVGSGILWIVSIAVVLLIGFCILSTGSAKGGMKKAGRHLSEMTGGLIGKKPRRDEDHEHS